MEGIIENIEIAGIASCVPKHFEDNMDYGNVLGERRGKKTDSVDWNKKKTYK